MARVAGERVEDEGVAVEGMAGSGSRGWQSKRTASAYPLDSAGAGARVLAAIADPDSCPRLVIAALGRNAAGAVLVAGHVER
jgi:hypothetical protein